MTLQRVGKMLCQRQYRSQRASFLCVILSQECKKNENKALFEHSSRRGEHLSFVATAFLDKKRADAWFHHAEMGEML